MPGSSSSGFFFYADAHLHSQTTLTPWAREIHAGRRPNLGPDELTRLAGCRKCNVLVCAMFFACSLVQITNRLIAIPRPFPSESAATPLPLPRLPACSYPMRKQSCAEMLLAQLRKHCRLLPHIVLRVLRSREKKKEEGHGKKAAEQTNHDECQEVQPERRHDPIHAAQLLA